MQKNMKLLLVVLPLLIMLGGGTFVAPVAATTDYQTTNLGNLYGASSTSWTIYNTLFESDDDVKSLITDQSLSLWGTDVTLSGLTLDYTEFSYGKHTTDWTGTVGSTTDLAYGGVKYWAPNVTSSPLTTTSGNAQVISDPTIATPASGGYKATATITFDDETTENSDIDGSGRNFLFGSVGDFAGVDIELNANSYVLMNAELTLSVLNSTAIPRVGFYFIIRTAGGADVAVCYSLASGVTTDTAWEDSSTSAGESALFATTDEDVVRWEVNTTVTTAHEVVRYWKVDDLLSQSAAYTSDTPAAIKEWGYFASSKYSSASSGGTVGTVVIKNLLFVDDIKDLALFEETDKSDSATQESNNFPNATSQAISPVDEYELVDGFDFAIDSNIPINRITLSAYTVEYAPTNYYSVYNRTGSIVQKQMVFDSNPPDDERITDPTTFYLNISVFSATYRIIALYETKIEADNAFFDSDGDLRSAYSATDKDGSPTINELSDIYDDLSEIEGGVRFGATSFNTVSDAKMFYVMYMATATDIARIDAGETSDSTGGLTFPGIFQVVQQNWLFFVGIIALIVGATIVVLWITGFLPLTKKDDKNRKGMPWWIKLLVIVIDLCFIISALSPFFV